MSKYNSGQGKGEKNKNEWNKGGNDKQGKGERSSIDGSFSMDMDAIRLSVSSFGETEDDIGIRKQKLTTLGTGRELIGYEISTVSTNSSEYLLVSEDCIDGNTSCFGICPGTPPALEELCFTLSTKKTGSSLIHMHTSEEDFSADDFRPCVRIVINAEQKAIVRLDYPPTPEGTHGDANSSLIPVAVIDQDNQLVFIFRSAMTTTTSGEYKIHPDVTEILTADGTGFVVAKVGPLESILLDDSNIPKRFSNASNPEKKKGTSTKNRKDQFCVLFMDSLLGRSWKQLIFSVGVVFFYQWLVQKVYGSNRRSASRKKKPNSGGGSACDDFCCSLA